MTNVVDPSPPNSPPIQKTNPWIYIIAAVVVLCCCCAGMIGLLIAFGPDILHELGIATSLVLSALI